MMHSVMNKGTFQWHQEKWPSVSLST